MADEAFAAVKDKTDFNQYDNDGNGYVRVHALAQSLRMTKRSRSMLSLSFTQGGLPKRLDLEVTFGVSNGFFQRSAKRTVATLPTNSPAVTDDACRCQGVRILNCIRRCQVWRVRT